MSSARLQVGLSPFRLLYQNHTEGLITNRNTFLTALEAGKRKIKASTDSLPGESLLPCS